MGWAERALAVYEILQKLSGLEMPLDILIYSCFFSLIVKELVSSDSNIFGKNKYYFTLTRNFLYGIALEKLAENSSEISK